MMTNDISQIFVVTKNEMIKSIRGRKFHVSILIVVLVFLLITSLEMMGSGWNNLNTMGSLASTYLSMFPLLIALIVALLSSIALVSEFEERTALILFTRPIRRTSILIGKILSCFLLEMLIIAIYYVCVTAVGAAKVADMSYADMGISFCMAVLYAFAASGIAFIVSAFLKKGSVSTIISLLVIIIVLPIASSMISANDNENWYMMDQAGNTVYTGIPGYVEEYNQTVEQAVDVMGNAVDILKGFTSDDIASSAKWLNEYITSPQFELLEPEVQDSLREIAKFLSIGKVAELDKMISALELINNIIGNNELKNPDIPREAAVLIVWGLVAYLVSWARFVKREF